MRPALSKSAQRVQDALNGFGLPFQVLELPASTRTAVEAAQAIGCAVGQIVKSLVFRGQTTGRPILVVASGANRVSEARVAALIGEKIARADAEFVRERTGYAIGGVPPVGHVEELETLIDEELLQYDAIWAAAGTPRAVFRLTPADLTRIVIGQVARIAE